MGPPIYHHAYVLVSNDGSTWTTVWENSSTVPDYSWGLQEFDISGVADNQPAVYLRWTMGPITYPAPLCGWNIDDVEIWAAGATVVPTSIPSLSEWGMISFMLLLILVSFYYVKRTKRV
ncbi:MAG: IPTL-CTERM sorting domain-containing protein [Deltaproteobacteria bacterium]|nr:IPTL-CTERM sorting domain-containing protein [Deltaproteobacteria bacterium]